MTGVTGTIDFLMLAKCWAVSMARDYGSSPYQNRTGPTARRGLIALHAHIIASAGAPGDEREYAGRKAAELVGDFMARRDYICFGDIEGKLEVLRVECTRCDRRGRYHVHKLIQKYGRRGNMMKW